MQFALFSRVSDLRSLLHTGLVAGKTQSLQRLATVGRSGNRIFWKGDFSCRLDWPLVQEVPGLSPVVKLPEGVADHTTSF